MMSPFAVVVVRDVDEFPFKIPGIPKENIVKEFAPDRADQSPGVWMRLWRLGDGLDLVDIKGWY